MNILVTGCNGQVGWELRRILQSLGDVTAIDVADLDLTDADTVRAYLRRQKPEILVNPAAYTAVDKAESELDLAMQINGIAPGVMAEEMARLGGLMVHYSTDYVFDGSKAAPWIETDAVGPLNAYGRTKLVGERAVQAAGGAHLIFRTSWVYGRRGGNFLLTMLRLARERDELRIVSDQHGAPTWCRSIAQGTLRAIQVCNANRARDAWPQEKSGLYHLTNGGETTWYGFTQAIVANAPELAERRRVKLTPIATAEYPLPARRPMHSTLSNAKFERVFGVRLEPWDVALAACLQSNEQID